MNQIEKYVNYIRRELELCEDGKKWGSVVVEVHFKDGKIGSMKINLGKSVKLEV